MFFLLADKRVCGRHTGGLVTNLFQNHVLGVSRLQLYPLLPASLQVAERAPVWPEGIQGPHNPHRWPISPLFGCPPLPCRHHDPGPVSMPGKCLHFHSPLGPEPNWHQTSPGSPLELVVAALNQVLILFSFAKRGNQNNRLRPESPRSYPQLGAGAGQACLLGGFQDSRRAQDWQLLSPTCGAEVELPSQQGPRIREAGPLGPLRTWFSLFLVSTGC